VPESDHAGLPERLLAGKGRFQICSGALQQSEPISDGPTTATARFPSIPAKQ
jgi:hypothetical protein